MYILLDEYACFFYRFFFSLNNQVPLYCYLLEGGCRLKNKILMRFYVMKKETCAVLTLFLPFFIFFLFIFSLQDHALGQKITWKNLPSVPLCVSVICFDLWKYMVHIDLVEVGNCFLFVFYCCYLDIIYQAVVECYVARTRTRYHTAPRHKEF